jgi:uncharacterized protein YbaR (Trm112 family)
MPIDKRLLEILCCPTTRQPVLPMNASQLAAFNAALAAGELRHADGSELPGPLAEGLITRDGKTVYRIDDGIPVMLAEQAINVSGVDGLRATGR